MPKLAPVRIRPRMSQEVIGGQGGGQGSQNPQDGNDHEGSPAAPGIRQFSSRGRAQHSSQQGGGYRYLYKERGQGKFVPDKEDCPGNDRQIKAKDQAPHRRNPGCQGEQRSLPDRIRRDWRWGRCLHPLSPWQKRS